MPPQIGRSFKTYTDRYAELESEFVTLKQLEAEHLNGLPMLPDLAYREEFKTRFHPSKSNMQDAVGEVTRLRERIRQHRESVLTAEEQKKLDVPAKAEPEKLKASDFDWDYE